MEHGREEHGRQGRKSMDLTPYQPEILQLLSDNRSHQYLVEYLLTKYQVSVSRPTLAKILHEWTGTKREITEDTPELRMAIADLFFSAYGLTDQKMLSILRKEGYIVTMRGLISIRKELHIYRNSSSNAPQKSTEELQELVNQEFAKGGILGYGRVHLTTHFHTQRHVIPRDRLWQIAKSNPAYMERVDSRTRKLHRRRGEYIVPGPDYIWSIDGHMKIEPYGIEIYAAIDTYSRLVLWIYVGVSASTQISVLSQYLTTISATNRKPHMIRSDRGIETPMLGDCHLALRRKDDPELNIEDVYIYGTSVKNQRIESWWEQLTGSQTNAWITYMRTLVGRGLYSKSVKADRIACNAIYIPILRKEIFGYMNNWNAHSIRKQRQRPNSAHGVPNILYYWPEDDVSTYGTTPDRTILEALQKDLKEFDPDEYLPPRTLAWCLKILHQEGIDPNTLSQEEELFEPGDRLHTGAYLFLRGKIEQHMKDGTEPFLTETVHPTGGIRWRPESEIPRKGVANNQVIADDGVDSNQSEGQSLI